MAISQGPDTQNYHSAIAYGARYTYIHLFINIWLLAPD